MDAVELFLAGGKPAGIWFCGKCRIVQKTKEDAERHCTCHTCGAYQDRRNGIRTECRECSNKRLRERTANRIETAAEVTDYTGLLFVDIDGWGGEDDYYTDMEALLDHYDDNEVDTPEWAFCCAEKPLHLDADRVIEWATDDHHESVADDLRGVAELTAAIEAFNKANEGVVSWYVDYKRKVRVPKLDAKGPDA